MRLVDKQIVYHLTSTNPYLTDWPFHPFMIDICTRRKHVETMLDWSVEEWTQRPESRNVGIPVRVKSIYLQQTTYYKTHYSSISRIIENCRRLVQSILPPWNIRLPFESLEGNEYTAFIELCSKHPEWHSTLSKAVAHYLDALLETRTTTEKGPETFLLPSVTDIGYIVEFKFSLHTWIYRRH